jgi:hypothetical protein
MSATTLTVKIKAKQRDKMNKLELNTEADRLQGEIDAILTNLNSPTIIDKETNELIKNEEYNPRKYKKLQKKYGGTEEYQKAKELKAKGGMIRKYVTGGSVNGKSGLVPKRTFIAIGCGKVMNNRRKKTKIY